MNFRLLLPAFLALALGPTVRGEAAPVPGGPSELLSAVLQSPSLTAAAGRLQANRERLGAAGQLADPEVETMGARRVGPMNDRSTVWEVSVQQPLPRKGERAAERQLAGAAVVMAEAEWADLVGDMAAEVAMGLAEAEGADQRIQLLNTQVARLRAVLQALESGLAGGGETRLADRLTVESRISTMTLMVEEERQMAANARAAVRGRLGLAPELPLPSILLPALAEVQPEAAAGVALARARAAEASAMASMARASANPMTAVGVRYEREETRMGNEDMVGLAFMSEIPWRSRRSARAQGRAAAAEQAAALAEADALKYRIAAALARVERADALAETSRQLGAATQRRLEAEYDTLLRSTSVGGGMGGSTVFEIVELLERVTENQLQVQRTETAAHVARAELWRYVPAVRFGPSPSSP